MVPENEIGLPLLLCRHFARLRDARCLRCPEGTGGLLGGRTHDARLREARRVIEEFGKKGSVELQIPDAGQKRRGQRDARGPRAGLLRGPVRRGLGTRRGGGQSASGAGRRLLRKQEEGEEGNHQLEHQSFGFDWRAGGLGGLEGARVGYNLSKHI